LTQPQQMTADEFFAPLLTPSPKSEPLALSFSAIETFNQCPRKYYYNYVLKLPRGTWPWLILGTFTHSALEKFHLYVLWYQRIGKEPNHRELMKRAFLSAHRVYHRKRKSIHFDITEKQLEQSKKILADYLNKVLKDYPNNFPKTRWAEKRFKFMIGPYLIRGFIDRIDQLSEKHYEIVDYKTSSKTKKVDADFQVSIYAYALKRILGIEDDDDFKIDTKLDFVKLKKEEVGYYKKGRKKEVEEYVIDAGDRITHAKNTLKNEEDWEPIDNDFCKFCDFKNRCYNERGLFR